MCLGFLGFFWLLFFGGFVVVIVGVFCLFGFFKMCIAIDIKELRIAENSNIA